jgi:hypothetical protein
MTSTTTGHVAAQAKLCRTQGQSSLQPIKLGLFKENQDRWDPYSSDIDLEITGKQTKHQLLWLWLQWKLPYTQK